jgi:hypothetical protein
MNYDQALLEHQFGISIATFIADYSLNEFQQLLSALIAHDDFYFTLSPFLDEDEDYETSDDTYATISEDYLDFISEDDDEENRTEFVKSQIDTLFALWQSENSRQKIWKFIWAIKNDVMEVIYKMRSEDDEEIPMWEEIELPSEVAWIDFQMVRNEALGIAFNL